METLSALLALCAGKSPVTGEFPSLRPVTLSFDVSLICTWTNSWVNNRNAGDLGRHRARYDVIVMLQPIFSNFSFSFLVFLCEYYWSLFARPITETERSSGWQPWYSLETLKTRFNVSSEYQSCHTGDLSVSVIDNKPAFDQVLAWHQIGEKPLLEPILTMFHYTIWRSETTKSVMIITFSSSDNYKSECNINIRTSFSRSFFLHHLFGVILCFLFLRCKILHYQYCRLRHQH